MFHKSCPHCERANAAHATGARHLYPIWHADCDACCRRVLVHYPEQSMSSMNMALIIGMRRGFPFVTALQRAIRDERLQLAANSLQCDDDGWSAPYIHDEKRSATRARASRVVGHLQVRDDFAASYLELRGEAAVRQFAQSRANRRGAGR